MKHFLVTQFNLKGIGRMASDREWNEWNEYRFPFFEKYTLPSLINQSERNFTWLLFFDKDTPSVCLEYIERWGKYNFIETFLLNGVEEFNTTYRDIILKLSRNQDWIISSRIDNDDALHYKGIEEIQRCFVKKDKILISLASGYVLDIKSKLLAHYYYFKSPFLSIIEKNDKETFVGIYKYGHTLWPNISFKFLKMLNGYYKSTDTSSTIYLVDYPYWVQLIHNNLQNTFYRGVPVLKPKQLGDYSIDLTSNKGSIFSIYRFNNYYLWKRYLWAVVYKLLYRKTNL